MVSTTRYRRDLMNPVFGKLPMYIVGLLVTDFNVVMGSTSPHESERVFHNFLHLDE